MNGASNSEPSKLVLHVEDDVLLGDAVAALLGVAGYRALTARSAPEALELVRGQGVRPDVLIVDFHLPGDDTGSDVAEQIARAVDYPVPTIMLTADLANSEVPWLPGAPILLAAKPIDPAVLLETIGHFGQWHRFERAHRRQTAATLRV